MRLIPGFPTLRRDRLAVVFVAVALVQFGLIALGVWGTISHREALARRAESFQNVSAIDSLLVAVLNAETRQRGYVISGDSTYLAPYLEGRTAVGASLAAVRERESDFSETRDSLVRLDPLISQKLAEMDATIALRKAGDEAAARNAVVAGSGVALMDNLRAELTTLRAAESARLASRIDTASQRGLLLGVTEATAAVLALGVIAWLYALFHVRGEASALRRSAAIKDEFVGFVSHELRTPIAVIAGNARLLERADLGDGRLNASVVEISTEADRLDTILERLGLLARAEAGQSFITEPLLLQRLIPSVVANHRRRFPGRDVRVDLDQQLPPACGDEVALRQIFQNLLSNAEKYGAPDSAITFDGLARTETVEVGITNTGERLDEVEFEAIFDPFFRAPSTASRMPGIGLGLTVCHRLAQAQGGTIRAEALPEGGARFTLSLPIAVADDDGEADTPHGATRCDGTDGRESVASA